jgi:acyl-CoA synthetase (AMP-forming)/AMP-acid ligase II
VRTHGVLAAQHAALAAAFPLRGDDVNLPGFPLAALHNLCSGTTTVLPAADLRAMADADPAEVLALIDGCGVTSLSGAPAFLSRLSTAILASGAPLASVRRIVIGGGPVGRALCARIRRAFPRAAAHVVYGASEAEPIAAASIDEVLAAADGDGFLVGRPARGTTIRIARPGDDRRQAGEIAVRGAHVSGAGEWHRTGDIGRLDDEGRLWLLGRVGADVVHRGRVLHPFAAEAVALALPGIRAAALVAHRGAPDGEMIVQLDPDRDAAAALGELRDALGRRGMATLRVRRHDAIPMDARHGSKVARAELLAQLAWEGR